MRVVICIQGERGCALEERHCVPQQLQERKGRALRGSSQLLSKTYLKAPPLTYVINNMNEPGLNLSHSPSLLWDQLSQLAEDQEACG